MKETILELNKPTRNGRIYTKEVIENTLADPVVKEKLATKNFFVVFNSSEYSYASTIDVCGVVTAFYITDNELSANIELVDTPKGKIVRQLIDSDLVYYFYTIGTGELDSTNTVTKFNLESIGFILGRRG